MVEIGSVVPQRRNNSPTPYEELTLPSRARAGEQIGGPYRGYRKEAPGQGGAGTPLLRYGQ